MKRFEIYIARRLTLGQGGAKSSPAVKVAVASVALSIAVMLLAVAIVFGFKREITRKIQGFNPHVTLYSAADGSDESAALRPGGELAHILDSVPCVVDWQPSVNTLALLKTPDAFKGVYLTGLSDGHDTAFLRENIVSGRMPDIANPEKSSHSLLLSRCVADELQLTAGDSVNLYSIGDNVSLRRMEVTGIYDSHLDMFDNMLAFSSIGTARALSGTPDDEATRIDITLTSLDNVDGDALILRDALHSAAEKGLIPPYIAIDTIHSRCAGIFGWLSLLDTNVWVILVLLTLVSTFTLISGMLIIILEKVRFIGVMKALGASSASVRHIFVWLAMRIGLTGIAIGTLAGMCAVCLQYYLHLVPLNPDAYYMDYVPVDFCWWGFAALVAGFVCVIYIVLAVPARLVGRISPAESMRFD